MKNQKGVTLVALVVTIIVLIILAGISINLILGDNGIITIAKRAKENIELAKIEEETELNELYTQLESSDTDSGGTNYDAIAKLREFKRIIATAITNKGVDTPQDATAEVMAENISKIYQTGYNDGQNYNLRNLSVVSSTGNSGKEASIKIPTGIKSGYIIACANGFSVPTLYIEGDGIISQEEVGAWQASQGASKANHIVKIFYCTLKEEGTAYAKMSVSGNNYATSIGLISGEDNNLKLCKSNGVGSTKCTIDVPEGVKSGYVITCANAFYVPSTYIEGEGIILQNLIGTWQASQGSMKANHIIKLYYCTFNENKAINAYMFSSGDNYATSIAIIGN